MSQRIQILIRFLLKQYVRSVSGILYMLSGVAFWLIVFSPQQGRVPESDYFVLTSAVYGFVLAFLVTLSLANRANRLDSASMLPRLASRVEYLAAVLLSALIFVLSVQFVIGFIIAVQPGGPELTAARILEIPPVWISINIFAVVLALHASDFVLNGWSRIYIFGTLSVLLFSQSVDARGINWLSGRLTTLASVATRQQMLTLAENLRTWSNWVSVNGQNFLTETIGFVFWPFRAISESLQSGYFDNAQSLAPAILLLYATILFMLAADFFATKDMQLTE